MSIPRIGAVRPDKRRRQAGDWFVMWREEQEFSPPRQRRWQKWVADARNQAEYQRYERLFAALQALPRQPLPSDAELRADTAGSAWAPLGYSRIAEILEQWRERARVSSLARAVFAMGGCAVALMVALALFVRSTADTKTHVYETKSGGRLDIPLNDHSSISLAGATRLTVLLTKQGPRVRLERGEAAFQVTHNPQRVFEVQAGDTVIKDLGTAFRVRRYPDQQVLVTVGDGAVEVTHRRRDGAGEETGGSHAARVRKGQEASDGAGMIEVRDVHLQEGSSMLDERRDYVGAPLKKVVEDAQLYLQRQIELDPGIASRDYTGDFEPDAVEEWVRQLQIVYPVEVDDSDRNRVVVRCRYSGCGKP
jgi:transmembrane sensor